MLLECVRLGTMGGKLPDCDNRELNHRICENGSRSTLNQGHALNEVHFQYKRGTTVKQARRKGVMIH
jgi:hypothetical protein